MTHVIRLIFFMSHRKDHTAITLLSGLTKKSVRSAVKSAVQLWSHLTGCSLWRKRETRLADDVKLLRQEEQERRKNIEKLIQIERNAKARIRRVTKSRTE